MELKFKCHNCGKTHTLSGTISYKCGQITLSLNLILIYKIIELEEELKKLGKCVLAIARGLPKIKSNKNKYEKGKPGIWRQK